MIQLLILHLLVQNHNKNARTMCEICQWRRSVVFVVNFEQISHIVLVFSLLTWNK